MLLWSNLDGAPFSLISSVPNNLIALVIRYFPSFLIRGNHDFSWTLWRRSKPDSAAHDVRVTFDSYTATLGKQLSGFSTAFGTG